jgi:site-specific recombinase XerD
VPGFRDELSQFGYSKSAAKRQLQLMARLSAWLEDENLEVFELATPRVGRFFQARRAEHYANLLTPRAVVPLVGYLRRVSVMGDPPAVVASGPVEVLVERFRVYLVSERALVDGTVRFYLHVARLFVSERLNRDGMELAGLRAGDVTGFTTRTCSTRGLSSARQVVSALRSFLRFLQLEGLTELALDGAVLSPAGWNPSLPRAISAADVTRLLAGCDRRTAIGRRDFAILKLLSRLGLRGGEIVVLGLDDIDWRAGEIEVHGKGRRHDRLPLPTDVGEALAAYLKRGRPSSDCRRVFLRHHAPFRGFAETGAIRGVLDRACARAGIAYVSPHRLRHTVATEMLRAGASLSDVGQILRHTGVATTAVYAKVDHERLRMLARAWPEVAA